MPRLTFFNYKSLSLLASFVALAFIGINVLTVEATPCVAFDSDFNLYALGFGEKDFQLGPQDNWSSTVNPTDITSTGRPPFDGSQTTCYLAQFFNAIYVLDGDKANPSSVHIYDVKGESWSTQEVSPGGPDPSSLVAILDHDTNVVYALAGGSMSSLDLGELKKANTTALAWNSVGQPPFDTANYKPTMALAQNHIHFIGVPNSQAGSANIYVIHFSFFQHDAQKYTVSGGVNPFPATHGQTASFFRTDGVQEEFAFIPDDSITTYIINVESNTTLPLAGPSDKSPSTYVASTNSLVQLTSSGSMFFLPYTPGNVDQSKAASWSKINVEGLPAVSSGNGSSSSGNPSSNGTAAGNGTGSIQDGGSGNNNGAVSIAIGTDVTILASMLGTIALALTV